MLVMTNTRRKTNKIIVLSALAILAVILIITLSLQSSADDELRDGLRAIQPTLDVKNAPKMAQGVCTRGVTVDNIVRAFFVDAATAARMTVPIATFCLG